MAFTVPSPAKPKQTTQVLAPGRAGSAPPSAQLKSQSPPPTQGAPPLSCPPRRRRCHLTRRECPVDTPLPPSHRGGSDIRRPSPPPECVFVPKLSPPLAQHKHPWGPASAGPLVAPPAPRLPGGLSSCVPASQPGQPGSGKMRQASARAVSLQPLGDPAGRRRGQPGGRRGQPGGRRGQPGGRRGQPRAPRDPPPPSGMPPSAPPAAASAPFHLKPPPPLAPRCPPAPSPDRSGQVRLSEGAPAVLLPLLVAGLVLSVPSESPRPPETRLLPAPVIPERVGLNTKV